MEISNYSKNKIKAEIIKNNPSVHTITSKASIEIKIFEDEDENDLYQFEILVTGSRIFSVGIIQMPFCCGYTVIGSLYIHYRYVSLFGFFLQEVEKMLMKDNVTTILTTVADYQKDCAKIFTDNGYSIIHQIINRRTNNVITMFSKTFLKSNDLWSDQK